MSIKELKCLQKLDGEVIDERRKDFFFRLIYFSEKWCELIAVTTARVRRGIRTRPLLKRLEGEVSDITIMNDKLKTREEDPLNSKVRMERLLANYAESKRETETAMKLQTYREIKKAYLQLKSAKATNNNVIAAKKNLKNKPKTKAAVKTMEAEDPICE